MTKVFIGGSRKIFTLNPEIKTRLDNIIEKDYAVLIGDANGADKAVQKYLTLAEKPGSYRLSSNGCSTNPNVRRNSSNHLQVGQSLV